MSMAVLGYRFRRFEVCFIARIFLRKTFLIVTFNSACLINFEGRGKILRFRSKGMVISKNFKKSNSKVLVAKY